MIYSSKMLPRSDTYRPSKNCVHISIDRPDGELESLSTHLTDILVPDSADLLDVGGALGDILQGVTGQLELVLDVGRGNDINAGLGSHAAHVLLTQEVTATVSIMQSVAGLGR